VIDVETALLQQFFNIVPRKRIAKIPPDCTKYEEELGMSPLRIAGRLIIARFFQIAA